MGEILIDLVLLLFAVILVLVVGYTAYWIAASGVLGA